MMIGVLLKEITIHESMILLIEYPVKVELVLRPNVWYLRLSTGPKPFIVIPLIHSFVKESNGLIIKLQYTLDPDDKIMT